MVFGVVRPAPQRVDDGVLPDAARPGDDDEHRAVGHVQVLDRVRAVAHRTTSRRPSRTDFELGRQRRRRADEVAVRRRGQLEPPGMEEQPAEPGRTAPRGAGAIDRIARDRVADGVEMDPDLVRPPGHQVELEQGPLGEPLANAIAGDRRAAVGHDRHLRPVLRVAPDRRLDAADGGGHAALDERQVRLLDPAGLELGHDRGLRRVGPGDHQQPARIAVEAMDDARPLDAGDAAPGLAVAVRQERVDQRAARMTGRRVDDEAGRLVDDQQVVVLVDDPQRDVGRGREIEGDRLRDVDRSSVPGPTIAFARSASPAEVRRPSEISFWT